MGGLIKTVLRSLRKSAPAAAAAPEAPPLIQAWGVAIPKPEGGAVYWPGIFEARDLENAKEIALTPDDAMTTAQRWGVETEFTVEHIASRIGVNERNRVIDFGCGPGRMSRALIERFGCSVVGVDIAQGMREQATAYVGSPRFQAVSPQEFDAMVAQGFAADFGLACWSLQHCIYPALEIARIANSLLLEAPFLLINGTLRLVPTNVGWHSDGEDLDARMAERFTQLERLQFPEGVATPEVIRASSISWWQRRL